MPKPATVPQFAHTGATPASGIVEPSPGKKASGFLPAEEPTAEECNWLFMWIYLWFAWLNTILTSGGGLTPAVDEHVTLSGTGRYKHGDIAHPVHGGAFQIVAVASAIATGTIPDFDGSAWGFSSAGTGEVVAWLDVPVGMRIKSVKWSFNKASQAAAMNFKVRKRVSATTSDIVTDSDVTSGASYITKTTSAINYTAATDERICLYVAAGHTAHAFDGAIVTLDWP